MKNVLIILLITLVVGCKKDPVSSQPPPQTNSNTSSISDLYGKWILKKSIKYDQNGYEVDYKNYYDTSLYYLDLKNISFTQGYSVAINGIFSPGTLISNSQWKIIDSVTLDIQGNIYPIKFQSSDSLVLNSPNQGTLILSKKPGYHKQNSMEGNLSRKWYLKSIKNLTNLIITPYSDSSINYVNLQSQWSSTGSGWLCELKYPFNQSMALLSTYKVLNDSFIITSDQRLIGKIDTITSGKLVISNSTEKFIFN